MSRLQSLGSYTQGRKRQQELIPAPPEYKHMNKQTVLVVWQYTQVNRNMTVTFREFVLLFIIATKLQLQNSYFSVLNIL